MNEPIHLGKSGRERFCLPIDMATLTVSILAVKGAGKTYTGSVLAEELIEHGVQTVVMDPLDVWYGLRSSADGKSEGYGVVVFGGEHGDLPLDVESAELIADVVIEQGLSAVLSLDHFNSKTQRRLFVTRFAERLFQIKNKQAHKDTPLHLMVDEADLFIPQKTYKGSERMLGAFVDLVRRGRSRGIGTTLMTQRPAVINKDVLTQTEMLIALRTLSPQDRKAMDEWVEAHDTEGRRDEFMSSLASLEIGEAWVWSPGWLGVFERVKVRKRRTFDSSYTPKIGQKRVKPKRKADIDLDAIRESVKVVIERTDQEDPKKLQAQIRQLERELKTQSAHVDEKQIQDLVDGAIAKRDGEWRELIEKQTDGLKCRAEGLIEQLCICIADAKEIDVPVFSRGASRAQATTPSAPARRITSPRPTGNGNSGMSRGERKILTALVQAGKPLSRRQVALWCEYAASSGSFSNLLSRLRTAGFIVDMAMDGGQGLEVSQDGVNALGPYEPLPTGTALHDYWIHRMGGGAPGRILELMIGNYPTPALREWIANQLGYELSGSFSNALSKLRGFNLIEDTGDRKIRAHPELMEA